MCVEFQSSREGTDKLTSSDKYYLGNFVPVTAAFHSLNALIASGKSLPSYVKFMNLGSLRDVTPPRAFAELYWDSSIAPRSLADESQIAIFWKLVDDQWLFFEQRERAAFSNTQSYARYVGDKLLLETTGDAKLLSNNMDFRVYSGWLFGVNGCPS